jgi:prepilin-type processing-associated H-X9-DG protein
MGEAATNSYAACYGSGTQITQEPDRGNGVFFRNSRIRLADISDGSSNTLAIGERAALLTRTPWCGAPCEGTIHITPGAPTDSTAVRHPATGQFLFGDGSVRRLQIQIDLAVFQALSTRNGGEVVPDVDF